MQLGFTDDTSTINDNGNDGMISTIDDENVNVNLIDEIDSITITALGFTAIAANMGDDGIGRFVARITYFFDNDSSQRSMLSQHNIIHY